MLAISNVIHERTIIIPINKNLSTDDKSPKCEYSLKKNFFDPSKSSPPNNFMNKLHMRFSAYYLDNKDDSRDSE